MAKVANVHRKSLLGIRLLEFAFEQPLASRPAKRVTRSPRSNLWHPLLEQEFTLREETVGKGLEVRIYLYTDRQPIERK